MHSLNVAFTYFAKIAKTGDIDKIANSASGPCIMY